MYSTGDAPVGYLITGCTFNAETTNASTDNLLYATIYNSSGVLQDTSTNGINNNTLSTSSYTEMSFTFGGTHTLADGDRIALFNTSGSNTNIRQAQENGSNMSPAMEEYQSGSWNGENTSYQIRQSVTWKTPVSSDLPENTIFNETDTYTQYFLQNDNWVATPLTKFNTQSNWSPLVSGNTIESGTSPQSYYFDQDTSGTNTLELPFSCDVNNCTIDWDKNSQSATTSGDTWTDINIATSSVGYGASSNGHSKIDIYQSSSAVDKYTINANSGSSDANTNEDSTGNMTLPTQDTWFYYRLTWKTNSDGTMTFKYRRYTDYARTTLSSLGTDAVGTTTFSVSDTAQWTPANLKYINITNANSIRPSRYANLCITNGIALPQVDE